MHMRTGVRWWKAQVWNLLIECQLSYSRVLGVNRGVVKKRKNESQVLANPL